MNLFTPMLIYGLLPRISHNTPWKSITKPLVLFLCILSFSFHANTQALPPTCTIITPGATGTGTSACIRQQLNYSANLGNNTGASYLWEFTSNSSGAAIVRGQGTSTPVIYTGTHAGQYTLRLTVSTAQGTESCSSSLNVVEVTSTSSFTPIRCHGGTSTLTISANGGVAPYTYTLQGYGSNQTGIFSALASGTYTLNINDASSGCIITKTITIPQPALPLAATTTHTNSGCNVESGTIDLTVTGGAAPYHYQWTTSNNGYIQQGQQDDQDLSGLIPGTYSVTITDANGCTTTTSATITRMSGLPATTETHTNVSCFGGSQGSINLSVSGGTAPYTYSWTTSAGGIIPAAQVHSQDLSGLSAATYSVVVTDAHGCTANRSVLIGQPALPLAASTTQVNSGCNAESGRIDLTVTGGAAPYRYTWTTTNGGYIQQGQDDDQDLSGLISGTYSVTITDANGCTTTASAIITRMSGLPSTTETHNNVACFGGSQGSIDLSVSGGTAPYTYSWTVSAGGAIPTAQTNSQDLTGLTAATYSVVVTDLHGCTANRSVLIAQPALPLEASTTQINSGCNAESGQVDLTVTGGAAPYRYTWIASNGGYIQQGQDDDQDLSGLIPGTYSVIITDANGCTATTAATITRMSGLPATTETHTNVTCFGGSQGSINLSVSGGTAPYTYSWTVSAGGAIPTGQAFNQDLSGLTAATYSVVVTDAHGCTANRSILIAQPAFPLAATTTQRNAGCNAGSGSIDLTVTGGAAPYRYSWTATNGGYIQEGQENDQDLSGLVKGTYSVLITDANGCTTTATATITRVAGLPASTETHTNVTCFGGSEGSINLSVSGGLAPYTYDWTVSAGGAIPAGQMHSQDLTGLLAATYSVVVTDANGCTDNRSVLISQPAFPLAATTTQVNTGCNNSSGSIDITVTGGSAPYSYTWSSAGGVVPAGQLHNQDLVGLNAGSYTVNITDAHGCRLEKTILITQSGSNISIIPTQTNVRCYGEASGAINIVVNGGPGQYTYQWSASNGGIIPAGQLNSQNLSGLVEGTYTLVVRNNSGCSNHISISITQPAAMVLSVVQSASQDCGTASAGIDLTVSGGNTPYAYTWTASNGGVVPMNQVHHQDLNGLVEGTYTVLVTANGGCTTTGSYEVSCPHPEFGCSHGFWKNHMQYWNDLSDYTVAHMPVNLAFTSSTDFFTYFNMRPGTSGLPNNLTMLGALQLGGGHCKGFSRDAVTALLDVASGQQITYPAGTHDFGSLYTAIRNALVNQNCDGTLRQQLGKIVNACHDGHDDGHDDDRLIQDPALPVTISAFPNPYRDRITFHIKSAVHGNASFELFDMMGTRLSMLYQGPIEKDIDKVFNYTPPATYKKTIFYRFKVGDKITMGKVLFLN